MPFLENLAEGLASAAGAEGAVDRIEKRKDQRKQLSDEERHSNLDVYNQALDKLTTHIGQIDPEKRNFQNPEWVKLNDALHQTISARTALFHPEHGPSAMGKLAEMLRIKKPVARTPGEAKAGMADVLSASVPAPEKPAPAKPEKPVKYSDYSASLRRFVEGEGGDPDNPTAAQEDAFRKHRGEEKQKTPKLTQEAQDFALYLKDKGKTPDQATWRDKREFNVSRYGSRNPYAAERLHIAKANLELRESEDDLHDYLRVQKQIDPLTRIQATAERSDEYVTNHNASGDIALTLAFVEAIKPSSGFRFTDVERRWILQSRGVVAGAQQRIEGGFTGEVLTPEQRTNMAAIIKNAAKEAGEQKTRLLGDVDKIKHPKTPKEAKDVFNPQRGAVQPSGKAVSLAKAKQLPEMKGKTDDEIKKAIEAAGHQVVP